MSSLPEFIDPHLIWIRNFPSDFLSTEIQEFIDICLVNTTATIVSITNKNCALVRFTTTLEPRHYIRELHQRPVKDRLLSVTYAKKLSQNTSTSAPVRNVPTSTADIKHNFSEFLKKLHATDLLFEQPPPPHLRYAYPKANRDILDAISIALETTPKLYTQVLHLMNRMNLEPPFIVGSKNLEWSSTSTKTNNSRLELVFQDAYSQTDGHSGGLIGTDESELESDIELDNKAVKRKRVIVDKVSNSKRIRSMLQSVQNGYINKLNGHVTTGTTVIEEAFEVNKSVMDRSIVIHAPTELNPVAESISTVVGSISVVQNDGTKASLSNFDSDVLKNRIPFDQLQSHPLFQNYSPGEPSNKLYIKNLAKNVDEDDLRTIYSRFLTPGQSLDIRVMKTGRMKGQAFVCFNDSYMDDESGYATVEMALRQTNGLILKDKVIVVMFGKK